MATIAKKTYVWADGSEHRHASPEAVMLRFDFTNGETLETRYDDLGVSCKVAAGWFGISEKVGNAYAGADDADDAFEKASAMYERLTEDMWVAAREGAGPRTSILAAAIVAVLVTAGRVSDDSPEVIKGVIAEKRVLCKEKEYREKAASRPDVKAEMDRIKAKQAVEKAAKSTQHADNVETETDSL